MYSERFYVEEHRSVDSCMIHCLKLKAALRQQNVNVNILTVKNSLDRIEYYEFVFKNSEDFSVLQLIK